jgi:hypothetical protein
MAGNFNPAACGDLIGVLNREKYFCGFSREDCYRRFKLTNYNASINKQSQTGKS